MKDFASKLLKWHKQFGRSGLPWQNQKDPYKVWLSEIMLQQTQVATVKDRYVAFLEIFPNVEKLANASEDEVMKLWAGMGYYTRARNLHACAKIIFQKHNGVFPNNSAILNELPGIGRSTAAAIASFCFGEQVSILDANVKRLLTRILGLEYSFKSKKSQEELWLKANELVPKNSKDMPIYTQALMDFGATFCTPKNPKCSICVFQKDCIAFQKDKVYLIPFKEKRVDVKSVQSEMLFIRTNDELLLQLRPSKGIWGGLWCLPESQWCDDSNTEIKTLELGVEEYSELPIEVLREPYQTSTLLKPRKHVFTHRVLYFQVRVIVLKEIIEIKNDKFQWVNFAELNNIGMPTPVKNLLDDYEVVSLSKR